LKAVIADLEAKLSAKETENANLKKELEEVKFAK